MRGKGFTLLELVVPIAIVMILVSVAMSGYGRNLGRPRLQFAGMTLVSDLRQMPAGGCQGETATESERGVSTGGRQAGSGVGRASAWSGSTESCGCS